MIKIKALIWTEGNIEHIKKHNVEVDEVEELCTGIFYDEPSYSNRISITGRIKSQRELTVIIAEEAEGCYRIITARDASRKERRKFL